MIKAAAEWRSDDGEAMHLSVQGADSWSPHALDWPLRDTSMFVEAGDFCWHVQRAGEGAVILLLHGTGASSHSWVPLIPFLVPHWEVIAIDLPGHGFTRTEKQKPLRLPYIANAVAELTDALQVAPFCVIGHSAGAAIMLRMMLDGALSPVQAVSINGALKPFDGAAAHLFPVFAKLLHLNPFTASFFAWQARDVGRVEGLIAQTGSQIPQTQRLCYETLLQHRAHVNGALSMMANWDLSDLWREIEDLAAACLFIAGAEDKAVAPGVSKAAAHRAPMGDFIEAEGLGHLAHEEAPERVAALISAVLKVAALKR